MANKRDPPAGDAVDRIVAQWARERPELNTQPAAIIGRLGRLHVYLDAGLERTFRRFGLTRSGWDVLAALRRCGVPYRLPQRELMSALMRASGTTSFRIDRLERQGLVRRTADPDDGRGTLVTLTKKGLRLVDVVAPQHLANEERLLRVFSKAERAALITLLRKLLLSFEPSPQTGESKRGKRRRDRTGIDPGRCGRPAKMKVS